MYRRHSDNCESAYIYNVKSLSVIILARVIMVWKLAHLYTPERNSKNKLFFFNDELFYSISFGKMMTVGLIISFNGYVTW